MTKPKSNGENNQDRVRFHYLKSSGYRVIHVDGAIGGPTPSGYIHMSMYSERNAIPIEQVQPINKDGSLGDPIETVKRDGVVRDMEIDAIMSIGTAKLIRDWLDSHIKLTE